jgi:WD40 repeat protein
VAAAVFSPDGRTLAVAPGGAAGDRSIRLYTIPPARPLALEPVGPAAAEHLAWDGAGKYLLAAATDGRVAIYQVPKKKPVYRETLDPAVEGRITAADLSPDGDWFVLAAGSIRLRTWRLPFMSAPLKAWGEVRQVFFVEGNAAVVTIDETGSAIRWLVNYGKVKADRTASLGTVRAGAASSDGAGFFTLDASGRIRGWRSADLEAIAAVDTSWCRD